MLISEHIATLQKILEENGDQELFMWVDDVDDRDGCLYPIKFPEIKVSNIDCNQYQIKPEFRNESGKILIVTTLSSDEFNRDQDDVQDLDLEIVGGIK